MNPLTAIGAIKPEAALPTNSVAPAAQLAFETQMTSALNANDSASAKTAPQGTETVKGEIALDSSISVAAIVRAAPPVVTTHIAVDPEQKAAEPNETPQPAQPAGEPQLQAIFATLPVAPSPTAAIAQPRQIDRVGHIAGKPPLPAEAKPAAEPLAPATIAGPLPFETVALSAVMELAQKMKLQPEAPSLDLHSNDWAARLSHEILHARDSAASELTFRLTPRHLGTLDVGLAETPYGLLVELRPSNEEAKAIIAREEPRLIEELRQRGVAVADPALQSGASGDGRHNRNGAIPRPFLSFPDPDRNSVEDRDRQGGQGQGRFA